MTQPPRRNDPASRAFRAVWRPLLFTAGLIFLGLGVIGLVTPVMPGVLFLILAAAAFARSSPRFERWLLAHPRLGPPVRQWRQHGSIPLQAKIVACVSMAASWLLLVWTDAPGAVVLCVGVALVACGLYVATRPDAPPSSGGGVTPP